MKFGPLRINLGPLGLNFRSHAALCHTRVGFIGVGGEHEPLAVPFELFGINLRPLAVNIRDLGVDCRLLGYFDVNFSPLGFDFMPLMVTFEPLEVHFFALVVNFEHL